LGMGCYGWYSLKCECSHTPPVVSSKIWKGERQRDLLRVIRPDSVQLKGTHIVPRPRLTWKGLPEARNRISGEGKTLLSQKRPGYHTRVRTPGGGGSTILLPRKKKTFERGGWSLDPTKHDSARGGRVTKTDHGRINYLEEGSMRKHPRYLIRGR